eukprot:TRINITY_DN6613_c1_g1_i4.p1 TRINITY_DN6613_c1_g1~~TRINITY_DN6613_c1_g1_i4.p1  ORF type:complete len:638 (+),score=116.73 TRINITY_DN6613_c1_g1_i4:37-1914(+)
MESSLSAAAAADDGGEMAGNLSNASGNGDNRLSARMQAAVLSDDFDVPSKPTKNSGDASASAAAKPAQMVMGDAHQVHGAGNCKKLTALQALAEADLICKDYMIEGYKNLVDLIPGEWSMFGRMACQIVTLPACCNCCFQYRFFEVDNGCVRGATTGGGENVWYGPGVHVFLGFGYEMGDISRVAESDAIVNGTKAILTVRQGFVGLAMIKGEPILLPPGLHQWDDPDIAFEKMIDLSSSLISMGPYTLVTVEEGYAAITQNNGKQTILAGGSSYMLTHQNWKFLAWLSLKMQTNKVGPLCMTTGDNIELSIISNVNWVIVDAVVAAGKNVDLNNGNDTLKLMRDDVNLQVTSSLAALVGSIRYGSQGAKGLQKATRTGQVSSPDGGENEDGGLGGAEGEPDPEDGKLGRKALWDPSRLQNAVDDANNICSRYGVEVLSINLISAAPADAKLVEIMSRGAVATVTAEETAKAAKAEANASLIAAKADAARAQAAAEALQIKARSEAEAATIAVQGEAARAQLAADALLCKARAEAEAVEIKAKSDAEAEKTRAEGSKAAGLALGDSEVATCLAKLKIAYAPFEKNQSSTYFFGLDGPSDLPKAILGKHLANEANSGLAVAASGLT